MDAVPLFVDVLQDEVELVIWYRVALDAIEGSARAPVSLSHFTRTYALVVLCLLGRVSIRVLNHYLFEQWQEYASTVARLYQVT